MKTDQVMMWFPVAFPPEFFSPKDVTRFPCRVEISHAPTPDLFVDGLSADPPDVLCVGDSIPFANTRTLLRLTDDMPGRPVIISLTEAIDVVTAVELMERGVFTIVSGTSGKRGLASAISRAFENRRAFRKIISISHSLERSRNTLERKSLALSAEKMKFRRKSSEAMLMRQVAERIGRSRALEDGLSSILPLLAEFTGAAHGVFLVSPGKDRWLECNTGSAEMQGMEFPRGVNVFRRAMPIAVLHDPIRILSAEESAGSPPNAVAFPVRVKERFFGYGVFWGAGLPAMSPDTLRVLETVGVQAGVFCQTAILQEQVESDRDRLAQANDELNFLFRLATFLHEDPDPDAVFERLSGEIGRFVPCDGIEILSLVGPPALLTTGRSDLNAQGDFPSYAEAWSGHLRSAHKIGVPVEELRIRAFPFLSSAPDGAAPDAGSRDGKRWESVLCFGKERVGIMVVHMRSGSPSRGGQEKVLKAVAAQLSLFLHNQSEREKVREMATHDCLTGLLNYRSFQEHFDREFERYLRYSRNLTVLMVDLDNFKQVNDTFGHQVGDQVLKAVGDIIARSLRKTDYAFRYGGDEFVILLPDRSIEQAEHLAQRVRSLVKQEIEGIPPFEFSLSLSIGIADCTILASKEKEELLLRADGALYLAKSKGRDRIQVAAVRNNSVFGELRAAEL